MKKICLSAAAFLIFACAGSCFDSYQKDIDRIYISHSSFGEADIEYKIDFVSRTFWKYTSGPERYEKRDESSENEGFVFVCDLDAGKTEIFLTDSAGYGLTRWKSSYFDENIMDGHQWKMIIVYADSEQISVSGSNKYPQTWNEMNAAFKELTGEDILIYKTID